MAALTIACPTEGQTVTTGDSGFVRLVLTQSSWMDWGLSAQAVMLDCRGAEVWRRAASFAKDECALPVTWPMIPGRYTLQAQAIGMAGRTNVTVISNFVVLPRPTMGE